MHARTKVVSLLAVSLVLGLVLSGCNNGSKPITLALNFSGTQSIDNGQSVAITVTGAGPKGVMWSLASAGTLTNATTTSVTYKAPAGPLTAAVTDHLTATSLDDSTKSVVLTINITPSPSITTTSPLPNGIVGTAYNQTITAAGGAGTLAFTVSVGTLPAGLTLSSAGAITGTPTTVGTSSFTIKVTDSSIGGTQSATKALSMTVNQAPAITSANNVTFVVGTAGTFTVKTTGTPTPSLTETGALPSGVTFKDNGDGTGTLSGTPAAGTAQNYAIMFTASNGVGTAATQNFTLTVGQPPAITSANSTTFTVGTAGTFTVTATGFPAPTFSETGALPTGVTLNATTGVLSGTPGAGTGKTYSITITASNGVGTAATQNFTLTVDQAPVITSANSTTFTVSTLGTFTVTASGFPAPSLSETGTLPTGVTFTPATGVLSGTPAPGTAGSYPITFTASNGVGTAATQNFTLTVGQPPAITSANSTTFTVGTAGTFTVTATGFPAPTFSETGALPTGVTLNATTGVLSGTPGAGTGKTYPITITASNGVGSNATQSFTLTVDQAPLITSANSATFTVAALGTFAVTTSGFPAPSLTESGTLPSGVSFKDNGNGTGTLSGTPASGTNGTYTIMFTASNGVGSNATQSFVLTVNNAPVITSANSATFTVGASGSFTVTATGTPTPTISESGTLPSGVTFTGGTGSANLSGTPAAGTGGTYTITFTAHNGVGTDATQTFTLTVNEAPSITSPSSIMFTEGATSSFTVTATGFPKPALTEVGALPTGVTFKDNGDGTGTLSGTPASGSSTGSPYNITFTANNGVGTPASQGFTLTVNSAPVFTTGTSTTFTVGTAGTFTVTSTGNPTPTVSESGTLPTGVTFTGGTGSGTLSGTPATGTGKTYPITFTATSSSGTTHQSFTLTVNEAPAITSANSATFTVGTNGSFTVTTTGFPLDPITETGALPTGVTFVDNGNNTATLSGTPAAGTAASYPMTITASNGVLPNATQNFTLTVSTSGITCGSGHESVFKGQYAFLFQGFDASGPVAIAGTFSADGTGKVALLAGVEDINRTAGVQTSVAINSTGSSYSVGADNRGCLTIATSSGTSTYAFSVGSLNGSSIATNGRMIETDSTGTLGSGVLRLQDPTAFSTAAVSGSFAFGASSTLSLSTSTRNRFAVLGSIALSGGSLTSGEEDFNLSGSIDGGTTGPATISGGSYSVSSNGRGTLSITVAAIGGFSGATFNDSVYVVSATEFLFMNIGAQSATNPLFAGSAMKQTGPFSTSSISGNNVVYSDGLCGGCGPGGTVAPNLTVAVIDITSAGNFTLTGDLDKGGTVTSQTFSGTYTADSSGRLLVTSASGGGVIYLVSSSQGGFFASSGNDVGIGFFEPQSGGPFTTASVTGTFSFGTTDPAEQNVGDISGVASFDGVGTVTGTSDNASLGSTPITNPFSQPYSVTNGTGTPGRGTILNNAGGTVNLIFYIISPSKVVLININNGGTVNANPPLLIGEK
jgi:large repetitive protein